ncbi:MAG TPA: O-acetyl-ADP-ribose deacetylase [Spirochaetia bacterium]|nr:O-acetyl-ADP-ribose deacetylase [Spirochaetia bacterium]
MDTFCDGRLVVMVGDLTEIQVDAIVNAANKGLLGGGGVDGAIHRKGGHTILEECRRIRSERYPDGMPAGQAVITTGGRLPCKHVIHTVGPVWAGGNHGEPEVLADAYRNSMKVAQENRIASLAFPAISTGVYGYPRELAARTAYAAIREHLSKNDLPQMVSLVFFSESDRSIFVSSIEDLK